MGWGWGAADEVRNKGQRGAARRGRDAAVPEMLRSCRLYVCSIVYHLRSSGFAQTPARPEAVGSDLLVGSRAENRPRLKAIGRKVSQATAAFAGEVSGERCILNGDTAGLG